MRRIIQIFILLVGIANTYGQELNGVWISSDTNLQKGLNASNDRAILDFDTNSILYFFSNTKNGITVNRKATKLKAKEIKKKFKIQKLNKNKLRLLASKNAVYSFSKLDLSHKIDMSEKELREFIMNQQCDLINGIKGQFTTEQFFKDKASEKPINRYQFINYSERDNGYWYIKKIKGNAFFVFTTGQHQAENVLQILEISLKGIELLPIQVNNSIKNLTFLKTCL